MRQSLLLISVSLAVLLSADVLAQDPIAIQFQTDPVLVRTGGDILFTVQTTSAVFSMTWKYQGGVTLGLWTTSGAVDNNVPQFQGRISITATQLRISSAQLRDAGNYEVEVIPNGNTGLATNSRSVVARVFDAVAGIELFLPSVAVEGGNVSLSCTSAAGTETSVQWDKGGTAITADSRINISGGSLIINPARRSDAGEYTCTISNPVSALTARKTLTVSYGPDTPVLTKSAEKDCVGEGDVLLGQSMRVTCTSDSLPPAVFTWQANGQPVTSSQADSGVLILQATSTSDSGRYVCTASNGVTGRTSTEGTNLAVVATCLNAGEVAAIVICSFVLLLIILILIIVFCLRRRRVQRRQRESTALQKTNINPRPVPPDPQPNGARDLGQGPQPPLYHTNRPTVLYTVPPENHQNQQTLPRNSLHNSNRRQHNEQSHTNGLQHNAIQNSNSHPNNGIDNPAFTRTDTEHLNTLPNTQQQNPNILIQTGTAQGGAQPPAVHVNLNTLPSTAQQSNNAPMPTVHVNLNSYPSNGHQTQQGSSVLPLTNTADNSASQNQHNQSHTSPRMQRGQYDLLNPQVNGYIDTPQPGLIPTGYTHYNGNNTHQRNANTQTYQQDPLPNTRSDPPDSAHPNSRTRDTAAASGSSLQQMPWDHLRGTPAYPRGTFQRNHVSTGFNSDSTDYTTHHPLGNTTISNRAQPEPQNQTNSQSRTPPRHNVDRQTQTHSSNPGAHSQGQNSRSVTQLEATPDTHRSPRAQRETIRQDIRNLSGGQTAPRQEATHSNNPQAQLLMTHQASVGRTALSHGPMTQQGLTAPQGTDTRALADPNHLPQALMAQQQKATQVLGTQTQPVIQGADRTRQGVAAAPPHSSAQHQSSNLTQAALEAHTQRSQTFRDRKQQTQAALLQPGPQARAPPAGAQRAPTPPPVIPITQFHALPKERTQHRSPARGPQPPRPPVNMPVAQRQQQVQQRRHAQHRPTTMHANHHHQPGNVHRHVHTHAAGHRPHTHFIHPQQAHRGRPR